MKKLLLAGFCVFAFTTNLSIQSDLYAQDALMQNSPYVERKLSQEESFKENLEKSNSQINKNRNDFLNYYNRGMTYYDHADYLFNINPINKTNQEIKDNQEKYFKYFELSVEDFEKSISLKSDYSHSYISLAKSLMKIDKVLDQMFLNIDKNFKSLGYVEKLSNKRSLYTLGRVKLEKIGRIYNDHLKTLKDLEKSKDTANKYAFENIKKAESLANNSPDIFQIYSEYYFNTDDYPKAEDYIKKVLAIDSRNSAAYNISGLINFAKKDYIKSENSFKAAVEINPENTRYIKNLALLYIRNKDLDKTMLNLNNGLDLEPQNESLKSSYLYFLSEFLKNKDSRKNTLNKITANLSQRKDKVPFNNLIKEANAISFNYDQLDKPKKELKKIKPAKKYRKRRY